MITFKIPVYLVVLFVYSTDLLTAQQLGGLPVIEESKFTALRDVDVSSHLSNLKTIFTDPANTLKIIENISNGTTVSVNCTTALIEVLYSLLVKRESWAIKMLDASAKIGSGITAGNFIWTGSYSTCMSINPKVDNLSLTAEPPLQFRPQYCWSQYSLNLNQTLPASTKLALKIGLCLPDTCSSGDITQILLHLTNISTIINNIIYLSDVTCVPLSRDIGGDYKAVICLVFCGLVISLITVATLYDLYIRCTKRTTDPKESKTELETKNDNDPSEIGSNSICINDDVKLLPIERRATLGGDVLRRCKDILLCFSFYTNASKLFNLNLSQDTLTCVNGIRVLSMAWVILGHTYMIGAVQSDNLLEAYAWTNDFSFLLIVQGILAVDTFFVLSGLLVTYLYLREYNRSDGKISWVQFYLHRYWRLTPVYVVVLFLFEDILSKYYSNGPFWQQDGLNGDNCEKYWWWNVLYINNFISNGKMCMGHTWYLANDMQFYVISPLILIFITRNIRVAGVISGAFILISWICAGTITSYYNLIQNSFISQDPKFFDYIYDKPYCRIGPYIIGMICGYLLHHFKCKANMNKIVVLSGWLIAIGLSSSITLGIYHNHMSHGVIALYQAISRSGWAIAVCWMIFACCNGYGGIINDFLSWPIWQPLGRLTYSSYLIHLVVIRVYFWSMDYPPHFSHPYLLFTFLGCFIVSYFSAVFISLSFESPLLAIEKLFVHKK